MPAVLDMSENWMRQPSHRKYHHARYLYVLRLKSSQQYIAYKAGLQLATVVFSASAYWVGRGESKHYRVIQALPCISRIFTP
jgi:hypothetical protein